MPIPDIGSVGPLRAPAAVAHSVESMGHTIGVQNCPQLGVKPDSTGLSLLFAWKMDVPAVRDHCVVCQSSCGERQL